MAIAKIAVTRIECRLFDDVRAEGGMNVSINSRVDEVSIEEAGRQKFVVAKWGLDTDYKPKIGKLMVEGKVWLAGDPDKITKKEGGRLDLTPEQGKEVHQMILRMPLIVSINMARELGLPLPINFPMVDIEGKGKEKEKKGAA